MAQRAYKTGEDFRREMEARRLAQQVLGESGQGGPPPPPPPAPPALPPDVAQRVLGVPDEAALEAETMLPGNVPGPGIHVPQFETEPEYVDDQTGGHNLPQPHRGEQIFDEVTGKGLVGAKDWAYKAGLIEDPGPIPNRVEPPYSSGFDIVRDPTDPAFSHFPFAGSRELDSSGQLIHNAPPYGQEKPKLNSAGEVVGWEKKKPGPARETIPRPGLLEPGMPEEGPDIDDDPRGGIQAAIAQAGRTVEDPGEDPGEYEPSVDEVNQIAASMPTEEGRSWLQKMMPALKIAGVAATGIGMAKSSDFRRGVLKGLGRELDLNRQLERQKQLSAAKLRPHKPMELKDNKIIYYDTVGNIQRIQDLGPDGPKIQDRIDQFSGTTQYKDIGKKLTNYAKLQAAVESDTPVGDVATIFAFIQGLDNTAVREGERDFLLGAAGLGEKISDFLGGRTVIKGRQLRESQLKGILEISKQWMDEEVKTFRGFRDGRVGSLKRTISGQDWNGLLDDPTRDWGTPDSREAQQQTPVTGAVKPGDVRTNPETGVTKRYLGNRKWETVKPSEAGGESEESPTTGNVPQRNNNWGNLKIGGVGDQYAMTDAEGNVMSDSQGHLIFPDEDAGRLALERDLEAKIEGDSPASRRILGHNPLNVGELSKVYLAGESEEGKAAWRDGVRSILKQDHGVETDILANIPVEILAQAIARQEGFFAG